MKYFIVFIKIPIIRMFKGVQIISITTIFSPSLITMVECIATVGLLPDLIMGRV